MLYSLSLLKMFNIGINCIRKTFINPWPLIWILFISMLNPAIPEILHRVDPLALLAATLRTYQRAGCDSEQLSLSCPHGTSISIELAQYGRAGDLTDHSLCPPIIVQKNINTTGNVVITGQNNGQIIDVTHNSSEQNESNLSKSSSPSCIVSGLQYTLLQTVVDACQKKRHCKFAVNVENLMRSDPCAGIRKFVEIAYKCRPYEFRSKVACSNDTILLVCNPYSRIAIYSASFGYIQQESAHCPHNNNITTTIDNNATKRCLVYYATETVMQICHGRRRCSVAASISVFGKPCNFNVPMTLKIVYTCIPRKVLKERYETVLEADELQTNIMDVDHSDLYDEDQFQREGDIVPLAPKLQSATPNTAHPLDLFNKHSKDFSTTLRPSVYSQDELTLEEHQQLFFIYVIISITVGLLIFTGLIIGRFAMQRNGSCRKNSFPLAHKNEQKLRNNSNDPDETDDKYQEQELNSDISQRGTILNSGHLSNINGDIDLINPSNGLYMACSTTPACTYVSCATYGTATSMLMPAASQYNVSTLRHLDSSTATDDAVTIRPQLLTPTGLRSTDTSHIASKIMTPFHRKTLPTTNLLSANGIDLMNIPPPPLTINENDIIATTTVTATALATPPTNYQLHNRIIRMPTTTSSSSNVYYDSTMDTMPKHLCRSIPSNDNPSYFYG